MKYLPPFDLLRRSLDVATVQHEARITLSDEDLVRLVKLLIRNIQVDEAWYIRTYEDVARAVRDGSVPSARQHFVEDGYFEGRRPFPIQVDERWYLQQYPDVADGIRNGALLSAQAHFDEDGYREGRLPFAP